MLDFDIVMDKVFFEAVTNTFSYLQTMFGTEVIQITPYICHHLQDFWKLMCALKKEKNILLMLDTHIMNVISDYEWNTVEMKSYSNVIVL